MVALLAGKGLALASGKPLIAVNHLEGHALSPRLVGPALAFPYLLLVGVLGKLFAPEPPYYQIILIHLVTYVGEIFGHSPALYEEGIRKRWVRAISLLYGQGVYHVLHHSSAVDCELKTSNNTVNIGPGPFFCWDRLFGTYKPLTDKLPPLGLHGNPELVHNPLRLLCAGFMQIAWELWHNRGVVTRLKIIFGPASWTPPLSRDFAVREPLVTEDGTAGTDVAPRTPARRAAAPT